ncbi:hypothetical protein QYM36_016138, partial [Artemia franciscana]
DISPSAIHGTRNSIVIGDKNGYCHFLNRSFHLTSCRCYLTSIRLLLPIQASSYIVTVGEDEEDAPSVLRVWDTEKNTSEDKLFCVHSSKLPVGKPSTFAVKDDLSAAAIGFENGSVVLLTGDLCRNRSTKQKVIFEGKSPITGLSWKESTKLPCLFITTKNEVFCYTSVAREKDKLDLCDSIGCDKGCSVLADLRNETMLFIARNDAIYSFTGGPESRGTCYAFDGEKKLIKWYRGYLVVVVKEQQSHGVPVSEGAEKNAVHVIDLAARSIAFSTTTSAVVNIFPVFGSLYVYTVDDRILELREKDLQTKLDTLFKKNLYDVAISIAKAHQYDADNLAELFRQYGDHLYAKGDHSIAMEQYIKTIGRIEPSYVIRKYLDSPRILSLTQYLELLHRERLATKDHTTLLINCYAKLRDTEKLSSFLCKDAKLGYDVETAIKICRHAGYIDEALKVAETNGRYDAALKILIEDKTEYQAAIDYIRTLNVEQVDSALRQYGSVLINQLPDLTTRLVTDLCVKFQLTDSENLGLPSVEDFLPIFATRPDKLTEFLEEILLHLSSPPTSLFHTLLENYLLVFSQNGDETQRMEAEEKALELLDSTSVKLRLDQALVACQSANFTKGILILYEKAKMYDQILAHHLKDNCWEKAVSTCRRFGVSDRSLWIKLLHESIVNPETPSYCLVESLNAVEKERLMSPLLVIELLCKSPTVDLGKTREFLLRMLVSEENSKEEDERIIEELREDCKKIRGEIKQLEEGAIVFQGSKCSVCSQPLDMPSVHFLCQHSFHQRCFDSYTEDENECIVCLPANKRIREQMKALEPSPGVDINSFFQKQISEAEDCFSVVAEYFGKGLFNQQEVKTLSKTAKPQLKQEKISQPENEPLSDARLRIQDRQTFHLKETTEAKIRQRETRDFSSSPQSEGRLRTDKAYASIPVNKD